MGSFTNLIGQLSRGSHSLSNVNSGAIALGKNTFWGKSFLILNWTKFVEHYGARSTQKTCPHQSEYNLLLG